MTPYRKYLRFIIPTVGALCLISCSGRATYRQDQVEQASQEPVILDIGLETIDETINIVLTYKNKSNRALFLNKYSSGIEEEPISQLFSITQLNGEEIPYIRPVASSIRNEDSINNYHMIQPNSEIRSKIRIDRTYRFPPGRKSYKVKYDMLHVTPTVDSVVRTRAVASFTMALEHETGDLASRAQAPLSPAQQAVVRGALSRAQTLLRSRLSALEDQPLKNEEMIRIRRWFGKSDVSAITEIKNNVRKTLTLASRLNESNVVNGPEAGDAYYHATVDPFDLTRHEINVYSTFYSVGLAGFSSKSGILAHEVSHFKDAAGLLDSDSLKWILKCQKAAEKEPGSTISVANCFEGYLEDEGK